MADSRSQEEVPEDLKNAVLHAPVCLDAEIQRLNMSFLENELGVKVANGELIYYDQRGKMSMTGAVSPGAVSSDEWSFIRPIEPITPIKPQFDTCIIWGPGAEARVAKRLIDLAPAIKHSIWTTTQEMLSKIPADPTMAPIVITLLRSAIAKERVLGATGRSKEASLPAVGDDDFIPAAQSVFPDDVYFNFMRLRSQYTWTIVEEDVHHRKELNSFKEQCNLILEKLLPGQLANKMEQYADRMQYLLDNDERYFPNKSACVEYEIGRHGLWAHLN
ncbi:hypothetical protein J3E68DRAFT_429076 [Trichoderma sp. SZMC 28012]